MADLKPVVFKLNGEKYGVDINLVNGIEREQRIVGVPNSPENIKGIINLYLCLDRCTFKLYYSIRL